MYNGVQEEYTILEDVRGLCWGWEGSNPYRHIYCRTAGGCPVCSRKIEDGGMNITMHGDVIAMFRNGGYVVNGIIKPFRQLKTNTFLSFIILIIKKVLQYTRWGCNIKMTVIMDNKHLC